MRGGRHDHLGPFDSWAPTGELRRWRAPRRPHRSRSDGRSAQRVGGGLGDRAQIGRDAIEQNGQTACGFTR
jgi:hypothetical protein